MNKKNMREMMNQFEDLMSAAAFAESGEFKTARQILTRRHKVLLVLTGMESDMKAARYALNISKRIGAGIEILYITKDNEEKSFLEEYLKELKTKGIEYQVTQCEESIREEIIRFIEGEKDIQFVVIDSQDLEVGHEKGGDIDLHGWKGLVCPLVLVSNMSKTWFWSQTCQKLSNISNT